MFDPLILNDAQQPSIAAGVIFYNGRVGQSISSLAAYRSVRESLPSYGSSYSLSVGFLFASERISVYLP